MGLLIDTSILVHLERTGQNPTDLRQPPGEDLAISAITLSEVLVGLYAARTDRQRARRQAFIDGAAAAFPIVSFDESAARIHAEMWTALANAGQKIGIQDSLIAATALAHGFAVLTMNVREFAHVPNLEVRSPDW